MSRSIEFLPRGLMAVAPDLATPSHGSGSTNRQVVNMGPERTYQSIKQFR